MTLNDECDKVLTVLFLELLRTQGAADIPPEVCRAKMNMVRLGSVKYTKAGSTYFYLCAGFSCD